MSVLTAHIAATHPPTAPESKAGCDIVRNAQVNTEGPVVADEHYCIPPLERVDLDEVLGLIRDKRYFVLHAPRQTGKTSTLLALRDLLNSGAEGDFRCIYVNVETAQSARENVGAAMQAILAALARQERLTLHARHLEAIWREALADTGPHEALQETLGRWAEADPRPLVLLIDEIDMLIGDALLAVLRQLRAGYPNRPRHYPQSVMLCGIRDVRDYRIRSSAENAIIAGGSAFNVRAESLRLGDFTEAELRALLTQHTAETGQPFSAAAVEAVWTEHLRAAVAGQTPSAAGPASTTSPGATARGRSSSTTSSTRGNT